MWCKTSLFLLSIVATATIVGEAMGATTNVDWTASGTNDWEQDGNWSPSVVPSIANESNARILNGGTARISQPGQSAKLITLAYGLVETGHIQLVSGSLETSLDENLCRGGTASFTQEAGTTNRVGGLLTVGEQSGAQGLYCLNGGVLSVPSNEINFGFLAGATGVMYQGGGVMTSIGPSRYLYIGRAAGAVGTYTLNGGSILLTGTNYVSVGHSGTGQFIQNGGDVVVDRNFNVGKEAGGYGNYFMSNGSFQAYWPVLGEKSGATGVVSITGGTFLGGHKMTVGQSGCGTVYQSAGVVGLTNQYLYLGELSSGSGKYVLSGTGKLMLTNEANYLYVGWDGNGTFIQSNGTVAVSNYLIIAKNNNATGLYRIEQGTLAVGQHLVLGEQASATGTLQIVGSAASINVKAYQQNSMSTLDIQLDAGGISPVNVATNAILNGELKIASPVELDYNTVVTVINAASISGVFARTNVVPPLVKVDVIYDTANGDVKVTHFRYPSKGFIMKVK